jgi:hypothetical protein
MHEQIPEPSGQSPASSQSTPESGPRPPQATERIGDPVVPTPQPREQSAAPGQQAHQQASQVAVQPAAAANDTAASVATATLSEADHKRDKFSKIMVGTGAAIMIGSLGPWVTAIGESAGGLAVRAGWFTLICGALLALYGAQGLRKDDPRVRNHGGAIAAVSVSAFVALTAVSVADDLGTLSAGTVDLGWGLIIVGIASFFAIWPLVVLRKDEMARRLNERGAQQSLAGWHGDPTGRCEQRYYDGSRWTEHVVRGGEQSTDPLEEATSPA